MCCGEKFSGTSATIQISLSQSAPVVLSNNNLEWNRIGVVVANGDEVRIQGNNFEGCVGPGIMVSGVWGLVVRCFEPTSVHFKIFR